MSADPSGPRDPQLPAKIRYDDREIAEILKRATELQRAAPSRPDPAGITLAELEDIAREAGIDVQHLRQAAREINRTPESSLETRILGAPLMLRLERVIEGEFPIDAFDELVPLLQTGTDGTGQASTVGRALTWTSTGGNNSRQLQVLVHAHDGETLIRIEERSDETAAALHIGFGAGGLAPGLPIGLAAAGAAGVLAGIGVGAVIITGCWALGRALYRSSTQKRRLKLEAVFGELVDLVESRIARGELESESAASPALPSGQPEPTR